MSKVLATIIAFVFALSTQGGAPSITLENAQQLDLLHILYRDNILDRDPYMIADVSFNSDGSLIGFVLTSSMDFDGEIIFYETEERSRSEFGDNFRLQGTRIEFSHEADIVAIGTANGDVLLYNISSLDQLNAHTISEGGGIRSLTFSADNEYLAVGANNTNLRGPYIFKVLDAEGEPIIQIATAEAGRSISYGSAFFPDNDAVIHAGTYSDPQGDVIAETIWIYSVETGEILASCGNYRPFTDDVIVTADGENVIYSAQDGLRVWNTQDCVQNSENWYLLEPATDLQVTALALHPFEPILAVGYRNDMGEGAPSGVIRLWNISTNELLVEMADFGKDSAISSLDFSPNGMFLASGSTFDGTVRLWGIPADE